MRGIYYQFYVDFHEKSASPRISLQETNGKIGLDGFNISNLSLVFDAPDPNM